MYIINILWLIAPVALLTILFILLISKSLIKGKKVFFAFFILILVYAILGVACYYFYEAFLSNQYISLLISLSCIGFGGFINIIVVYLGIAKLKKIDSKEELLRLQHDIEKNMQVEDKWLNMLFSYTADRWTISDINTDLFSKLDEGNFEEDGAEIIEMNKEIKNINENYKFLKRNLRRKYFFLKNLKSITNLEDKDEVKKLITKKKFEFSISKETDKTIELVKTLSNELLNLVKLEENDKTKNVEDNLARTINYMSSILYNQLRNEKTKIKESKFNEFSTESFIIDLGTIEIVEKDGKIVKEKRKIPPIMLKNTINIYWLENAFHPNSVDTYYYYWLDKYKGEFGDAKTIYFNPKLVKIPNDIKKIIENKKKLSNIEQKVGETWQGKVITNDTNLNILTWEKVDE